MSDRLLDKISKVLHLAENASTPEEAETYMQKAQELATANSIDLAMARAHQHDKTKRQTPEKRTVKIRGEGAGWRKEPATQWKCALYMKIADVNDLEYTLSQSHEYVWPVGFPGDLDVAEALYGSLVVQMVALADAALKRNEHKTLERTVKRVREEIPEDEREWGGCNDRYEPYADSQREIDRGWTNRPAPPKFRLVAVRDEEGNRVFEEKWVSRVDGRVFRMNFYEGFVHRIALRLWEAKRAAMKAREEVSTEEQNTETGIVLRDKAKEVQEFFKDDIGDRKLSAYRGAENKQTSWAGLESGQRAAAHAVLGTESTLGAGRTREIG